MEIEVAFHGKNCYNQMRFRLESDVMRYDKEVNEIMNKIKNVEHDIVGLMEKVKNDAITDERDRMRFAIVQYALDNNIDAMVIEPFIKMIGGR